MGTWGTGLYSSDEAQEIKDLCQEIYPYYSEDRCWKIICEEFKDYIEAKEYDNDTASFWYALADWQWKHGILKDEIKEKVTGMLESRAGIEEWEEEGNKSDVRKRIAVGAPSVRKVPHGFVSQIKYCVVLERYSSLAMPFLPLLHFFVSNARGSILPFLRETALG